MRHNSQQKGCSARHCVPGLAAAQLQESLAGRMVTVLRPF